MKKKTVANQVSTAKETGAHHRQPVIGHETQCAFFKKLLATERLPSTLLFSGSPGIGKRQVAYELAQTLFCENKRWGGCATCHSCKTFLAGNTSDLYQIDFASEDQGAIDDVRRLLYSLQLKSFAGKSRVVLFDNAQLMSIAVTNVLLKTLEEPRPNTFFVLISSSKARMLPTLLSRSQIVHFDSLTIDQMTQIISQAPQIVPASVSAEQKNLILPLADGSFENLRSLSGEAERVSDLSEKIESIIDGDRIQALKLATELAKDKPHLAETFRLLTILLRTKLHQESDTAKKRLVAFGLSNCINGERLALERNLSAQYILTLILINLIPSTEIAEPVLIEQVAV